MLVVLIAVVWPLAEYFWLWPRHLRAIAAGDPGARTRMYSSTLVQQWTLAGAAIALTLGFARPFATLGLSAPHGWRLWLGVGLPVAYAALIVQQIRILAKKPETLRRMREKIGPLRPLIPHTPEEMGLFVPLSFTAGICEELLFRGYLVWALQSWIGLPAAAITSMVIFGLAHMYQGFKFGLRATYAGIVMGVLALVTGSVLPGMALHALIDLGSGWVCYLAVRGDGETRQGETRHEMSAGAA
jgi:membrane protease YdiL (CAAX protease family)